MKKILTLAMALLVSHAAFAAYQYTPKGSFVFDSATTVTMTKPDSTRTGIIGSIYDSIYLTVANYGYYSLSNPFELISVSEGGLLGTFEAGEEIGIWIQNTRGDVYTSTSTPYDRNGYSGSYGDSYCIYATHPLFAPSHWEYSLSGTEAGSGAPTGQPLPGLLATLLIGGGVLALKRRGSAGKSLKGA